MKRVILTIIILLMCGHAFAFSSPSGGSLNIDGKPIKVKIYGDGSMGVWRWDRDTSTYIQQVYSNNSAGSYLFVNGTGYCSGAGSFCGLEKRFTPVSNERIGTSSTIVTTYNAGDTGIQITQITTYTEGYDYYTMVWSIMNNSNKTYPDLKFFHGADTYWSGSDYGYGHWNNNKKMVFVTYNEVNKLMGLSGAEANSYYADLWSSVRSAVSRASLSNSVNGKYHDAAYSLGWDKSSLTPGENWAIVATEKLSYALDSIQVTPATATILLGGTISLSAVGYDCDHNAVTITPSWLAEKGRFTPTVGTQTVFEGTALGTMIIGCAYSGVVGTASIEVEYGDLKSIEIKPGDKNMSRGSSMVFKAMGYNTNNCSLSLSVEWEITQGIGELLSLSGTSTTFAALELGEGTLTAGFDDKKAYVRIKVVKPPPSITAVFSEEGTKTTTIIGHDFQPNATVILSRAEYPVIIGTGTNGIGTTTLTTIFDLTGVASGAWSVVVKNPDGQSGTLTNGFMVIDPLGQKPALASISPNTGTNNTTISILITGYNLYPWTSVILTKAGEPDIVGRITGAGTSTMKVDFDLNGVGTGTWDVMVINPNGETDTLSDGFTVIDASLDKPSISNLTNNKGTSNTTASTTITGSNFHTGAKVSLVMPGMGDVTGSVTVVDKDTLNVDFNLTGVEAGNWAVVVKNPDGMTGTLSNGFTVVKSLTPEISGIIGGIGMNNATATAIITGVNFQPGAMVSLVRDGVSLSGTASVLGDSLARIDFDLRGVGTGTWAVKVTNPDGTTGTLSDGFRVMDSFGDYQGFPMIMDMSTHTASTDTGTVSLTMLGFNLGSGTTVLLRKDGCQDIMGNAFAIGSNTLNVTFDLTGKEAGNWNIVVTGPDGISTTIKDGFTILGNTSSDNKATDISGLSLNQGGNNAVVTTMITGTNLGTVAVVTLVKSGEPVVVGITTMVGSNTIMTTFDLNGVAPGKWDVKVTNQDGKAALLPQGFEIIGAGFDLNDVHVYPNPYKPYQGHTVIYFKHLTPVCFLRIFAITGELIWEKEVNNPEGMAEWDVRNLSGEDVESDIYLYFITNDKNQRTSGKISVIR